MYLGFDCWTIQISMHYLQFRFRCITYYTHTHLPHFAGSYDLAPSKFVTSARQTMDGLDSTEGQHARLFIRPLTASAFEAWATLSPDVRFLSNSEPVDLQTSPIPPYNNSSIGFSEENGPDVLVGYCRFVAKWEEKKNIKLPLFEAWSSRRSRRQHYGLP
jgi:hypothetical protein